MATMQELFGAITEPLTAKYGVPFEHWHTGGGCTAIAATMDGGLELMITDAYGSVNGDEAFITDMIQRKALGENTIGYAVGAYLDEGSTMIAWADCPTAVCDDLPEIIDGLLDQISKARRMVAQVRELEGSHTNSKGEIMPRATNFSMLHDYIDANAGWGDDIDDLPIDEWNLLADCVDQILKSEAHQETFKK